MGTDDKDRNLKEKEKTVERRFGMGRPQDQKGIERNSSDLERHFRETLVRTSSSIFKVMVMGLTLLVLLVIFTMLAFGAQKCYLTPNFTIDEFTRKCKDNLPSTLRPNLNELTNNLQIIRNHIHKPVVVISGYRSHKCNFRVKGAQKSQHIQAKAADIIVKNMSHHDLHQVILQLIKKGKIREGGVGLYRTHVHYDIRGYRSRWHRATDQFINVLGGFTDEGG